MFNQEFITWNLVVVGAYDGLCGCQSGTVKSEPVPSEKLLRKCKTNWRSTIGRVPETRKSLDLHRQTTDRQTK